MLDANLTELPVVDGHINLASSRVIPARFIEDQAENTFQRMAIGNPHLKRARIFDMVAAVYNDHLGDKLVAEMDTAGIFRGILLAPDFSIPIKSAPTLEEVRNQHAKVLEQHPGRFLVFGGVDPRHGRDGLDLFARAIADGIYHGLKLYPLCGYWPSDPALEPYLEICRDKSLPVLCHTGPGWQALDYTYGNPLCIDGASRRFPEVNFILGHGAVTHVEEAVYLAGFRKNVFLDTGGFFSVLNAAGWQRHLASVFGSGIAQKIIFGTSYPAFRLSTDMTKLLAAVRAVDGPFRNCSPRDVKQILYGNLNRITFHQQQETPA